MLGRVLSVLESRAVSVSVSISISVSVSVSVCLSRRTVCCFVAKEGTVDRALEDGGRGEEELLRKVHRATHRKQTTTTTTTTTTTAAAAAAAASRCRCRNHSTVTVTITVTVTVTVTFIQTSRAVATRYIVQVAQVVSVDLDDNGEAAGEGHDEHAPEVFRPHVYGGGPLQRMEGRRMEGEYT